MSALSGFKMNLEYWDEEFYNKISKPWLDSIFLVGTVDLSRHSDPDRTIKSLLKDAVTYNHPAVEIILSHFGVPRTLSLKEKLAFFHLIGTVKD